MQQLQKVLNVLRHHKLCLNLEKCAFAMESIKYLGYVIESVGIRVDPDKIQTIREWTVLRNFQELRIFLGLANFYHRFVFGFSHIAWPLNQLTNGGGRKTSRWMTIQQQAFDHLMNKLCKSPVLVLPDLYQPFEVETDASDYAMDAVITKLGHLVARIGKGYLNG